MNTIYPGVATEIQFRKKPHKPSIVDIQFRPLEDWGAEEGEAEIDEMEEDGAEVDAEIEENESALAAADAVTTEAVGQGVMAMKIDNSVDDEEPPKKMMMTTVEKPAAAIEEEMNAESATVTREQVSH